jgi:hypothetical protein
VPQVVNVKVSNRRILYRVPECVRHIAPRPRPTIPPKTRARPLTRAKGSEDRQGLGAQGGILCLPGLGLPQGGNSRCPVNVTPTQIAGFPKSQAGFSQQTYQGA